MIITGSIVIVVANYEVEGFLVCLKLTSVSAVASTGCGYHKSRPQLPTVLHPDSLRSFSIDTR